METELSRENLIKFQKFIERKHIMEVKLTKTKYLGDNGFYVSVERLNELKTSSKTRIFWLHLHFLGDVRDSLYLAYRVDYLQSFDLCGTNFGDLVLSKRIWTLKVNSCSALYDDFPKFCDNFTKTRTSFKHLKHLAIVHPAFKECYIYDLYGFYARKTYF
jgi:hypothetical protein